MLSRLNEAQRRWYVGVLSQQPHRPSDRHLAEITGLDEKTIRRGRRELAAGSRVVAYMYGLGEWAATETRLVTDQYGRRSPIYLWRMG